MSLIENLVNQISSQSIGNITKPTGFDIDDDTFAKLLEKQLNSVENQSTNNLIGNFGIPAGLIIEPIDGVEFSEIAQDQMEILGENKLTRDEYINQPIEFKDINMDDYFSSLLKLGTNSNSDFMNFAKKNATNAYNVFSKNFVSDVQDFIEDITANI